MSKISLPAPFCLLPSSALSEQAFEAGEHVFSFEEPANGFFFVVSGEIQMSRQSESGDHIIIHRAFENEFFAEASLFSETYHCDAQAVAASKIIKINRKWTLTLMRENAAFAHDISAAFARQVQTYRRLLELRSIRSARERVKAAVADGWLMGNVISFASQIGLSHEATYRALSDLTKQGFLRKTGRGSYSIRDTSK